MEMTAKQLEAKAGNVVRRVIQKVRVATPETFDDLEIELLNTIEQELENLGSIYEKVQEEAEKGLTQGRKRVEQVLQQREKEEAKDARPRELLKELRELMEPLELQVGKLKEMPKASGPEDVPETERLIEESGKEVQAMVKECSEFLGKNIVEMRAPTIKADIKLKWGQAVQKIDQLKKDALITLTQAKQAVNAVAASAKLEQLERRKVELRDKVKESSWAVTAAEQAVTDAEGLVEPFARVRRTPVDMAALAEEVDESISAAKSSISTARQEMKPVELDDDVDESQKATLEACLKVEAKRPMMRLGQLENRVMRAVNLVERYRKETQQSQNVLLYDEMKDQLLEKMKSASTTAVPNADASVKEAEKQAELFGKYKKMGVSEMMNFADEVSKAIDEAKESIESARQEICPIDENVNEDLKKQLHALVAEQVKKPEIRLCQMDRRVARMTNLLTSFRAEAQKKRDAEHGQVRQAMLRVFRFNLETKGITAEELWGTWDGADSGVAAKGEILAFFELADTMVKAAGGDGESEAVELPPEELSALLDSYGSEETITRAEFMKMVAAEMEVIKEAAITGGLSMTKSKALRKLKKGEVLTVLEGPLQEPAAKVMRVRVRSKTDGTEGWVTVAGNAGSVFLKEKEEK